MVAMTDHNGQQGRRARARAAIERLMQPRSVAIIGMSSKPGTPSGTVLRNLLGDGYRGEVHLVGRSGGTIEGRTCVTRISDLPKGIDTAIMVVAADDVRPTLEALIEREVGATVCFASGFAETGEQGLGQQQEIGRIAADSGIALVGPNCVGYYNFINPFQAMLAPSPRIVALPQDIGRTVAVVTQSGGMGHHTTLTLKARGVPISHMVTTGNEADLGIPDFIDYLLDQPTTGVIACYAEQIRRPADMLEVAGRAVRQGVRIILYHPGRSAAARAATATHSGAMVGDHAAMRTIVETAGVLVVDTVEELIDLSQLMWRYPRHSGKGIGVVTGSGAIAVIAADYCDALGVDVPAMSKPQVDMVRPLLPDFITVRNPLDLGTSVAFAPEVVGIATGAMLADPAVGSILISNPYVGGPIGTAWASGVAAHGGDKPRIYVIHDEDVPLPPEDATILAEARMMVLRSPERALRALAGYTYHARRGSPADERRVAALPSDLPQLGHGANSEWLGKQLLSRIGITVPDGRLATSVDEACAIAGEIGFPVAMKLQARALTHKTEVGGVLLNIADEAALRASWERLQASAARAARGTAIDGILVEKMAPDGLELAVGARRDPQWGPVVMAGLGGVRIEALGDVRLFPPEVGEEEIARELLRLRGARLLTGFRGAPPVDVAAVARVVALVGRLMVERPDIAEVDINPLVALPEGQGVIALDALVVTNGEPAGEKQEPAKA